MEIGNIIDYLNTKDIMLKEHNADYISNDMLKIHPKIGIHAMNVAPEFGVVETRAMLKWFTKNNLNSDCMALKIHAQAKGPLPTLGKFTISTSKLPSLDSNQSWRFRE